MEVAITVETVDTVDTVWSKMCEWVMEWMDGWMDTP